MRVFWQYAQRTFSNLISKPTTKTTFADLYVEKNYLLNNRLIKWYHGNKWKI